MTNKEIALRRILKDISDLAFFSSNVSSSAFIDKWMEKNRHRGDVKTLLEFPLRDKFFKECTRKREDGITELNCMPHNVFEWFKTNIE